MTKKRFTITKGFDEHERQIRDNGKIIMGCFIQPQAEPIVKLLNELHEENKKLKQVNEMLQMDFAMTERNLMEENEQLKDAIIGKIQYGGDLEKFAIEKGLIQEDWARFDDYD